MPTGRCGSGRRRPQPEPPGGGAGGRAAAHRPRRLGRGGDRPRAGDRRPHTGAAAWPRRASARRPPARAGRRGRATRLDGRPAARLHPPRRATRTRWSGRACAPTSSAGAATGPSSRSPTSARCWRRSPTRSTTRRCFGALASPACGVSPDTLWLLRAAAGRSRHLWPALERAVGSNEDEEELEEPALLEAIPANDLELLERFTTALRSLRRRAPLLSLPDLIEAAVGETGYDLAVLMRPLRRGPLRQRAQADADGGRVRGRRGPRPARPARLPRRPRRGRRRSPRRRPRSRATTACES